MIYTKEIDLKDYIVVTYYLQSKVDLADAAWNIAIGQSVGNPSIRNSHESPDLFKRHACKILHSASELKSNQMGEVKIAFPIINLGISDGITQLLVHIMGGQLDINSIVKCQVRDIEFPPAYAAIFPRNEFGIEGIREYTGVYNKPLLGGIIKPKTGMKPSQLLDMVKIMVENGVDFIKEDEILSNPHFCPLPKRIELVMDYLQGSSKKVIYTFCMNSDWLLLNDVFDNFDYPITPGIHVNFWNGLGTYGVLTERMIPMFLFFQKSGITILTNPNHDYHISWKVICKMATLMGIDFIHAGMWGGYSHDDEDDLKEIMAILHQGKIMPSLSCGMHPGLVNKVTEKFGVDYMANVGGAIHGHPDGTGAGVRAMRQAIDGNFGKEYNQAIGKWGKI